MWLFLLFVTIPIIEIALFIRVGEWLGLWPTLAMVIVTAILGTFLVRAQGLAAMSRIKSNLEAFNDPTEALAHGAMILASGLLLLTPGFFTDAVGFALLAPPIRIGLFHWLRARINVKSFVQPGGPANGPRDNTGDFIDAEYEEVSQKDRPTNNGPSGWTRH